MANKLLSILLGGLTFGIVTIVAKLLGNAGAGIVGGLLSSAAYVIGAWATVWAYSGLTASQPELRQGAGMGAFLGGLCALVVPMVSLVLIRVGIVSDPVAVLEQQLAAMPEAQRALAKQIFEFSRSPLGIVTNAVVGAILGALGGGARAWVFRQQKEVSQPGPASTPT